MVADTYRLPRNLYGPRDNFDLMSSHVMPALMRKFHEAKMSGAPTVTVWGSGKPLRELLHVDDLARGAVFCMDNYDEYEHINCGAGSDVTILALAKHAVGYFASNFQDFSKSGLRGHLFAPHGIESIFSNIARNNEIFVQTVDILRYIYKNLIAEGVKRKGMDLHFGLGDIFTGSGSPLYVQPPASYYIKCFDHVCGCAEFNSVELIYEDHKNPAVQIVEKALLGRGIDFESCGATIKKDLSHLLLADFIVSLFGAFCERAAWLSNYLTKFYCFRGGMGREFLHSFSQSWLKDFMFIKNIEFYVCDDFELKYINPRSWENTAGQCWEVESFPGDFLRIYKYD